MLHALQQSRAVYEGDSVEVGIRKEVAAIQQRLKVQENCLPRFHFAAKSKSSVAFLLAQAARDSTCHVWKDVTREHWAELARLMRKHSTSGDKDENIEGLGAGQANEPIDLHGRLIKYEAFQEVAKEFAALCGEGVMPLFAARTFLRFRRDAVGAISAHVLMDYLLGCGLRLALWQVLTSLDSDGDGYLTEPELETAMLTIAGSAMLELPEPELCIWSAIAPRRVLFHLGQANQVEIKALLSDDMLDDITSCCGSPSARPDVGPVLDWFSPQKARAIHAKFVELDVDKDGMLAPEELWRVRMATDGATCTMTAFFVTRVFEEHVHGVSPLNGQPAMSLPEFADFLLAWNYRGQMPSVKYFYRALDVECKGYLTAPVVEMWCKHVAHVAVEQMNALYPYEAADVKDEVFDMVTPVTPGRVTLQDLLQCGLGDVICGMLVDGQCHYEYDQREALQGQEDASS